MNSHSVTQATGQKNHIWGFYLLLNILIIEYDGILSYFVSEIWWSKEILLWEKVYFLYKVEIWWQDYFRE